MRTDHEAVAAEQRRTDDCLSSHVPVMEAANGIRTPQDALEKARLNLASRGSDCAAHIIAAARGDLDEIPADCRLSEVTEEQKPTVESCPRYANALHAVTVLGREQGEEILHLSDRS